jgi:hypothetical protein
MSNYFTTHTDYISNSQLGNLEKMLRGEMETPQQLQNKLNNYRLGTLFDFVCTEPDLINFDENYFTGHDGVITFFSEKEKDNALGWFEKLKQHPLLSTLIKFSNSQKEVYNDNFQVNHQGQEFTVKAKGKFDLYTDLGFAGDLKYVSAKNQKTFENMIQMFSYDRQASFYTDIDGRVIDTFLIIGVPKLHDYRYHDPFIYVVEKDSEEYKKGKAKYEKLCFDYYTLIDSF